MGKRKRRTSAEPTLFDLPLHDAGGEEPEASEAAPDSDSGRGPSILFDRDESQLDQLELGSASSGAQAAETPAAESADTASDGDEPASDGDASTSERAYPGDRLLGGLADLAAQLIALGLAIAAVHSLGIVVTVADWMPFGVLALVFSFLYWCVPLAFWGRTPGMAWVGHTARSANGEPLSFGQTFLRWLGAVLTLGLAGLPLLLTLTGRSLTDRISDSRTIGTGR